ncbi:4-dihydroxylase TPA1 (Termination and polyadenylation protein 1) (uS12 prolyl 3 [Durusdinium trenchii]|uniref:4-dihydroxylase TPA1 (Termination and polyadenylation protein 1) (uS12 prolyl 3) n=1 Tax=Durusdinium trenchii TaxID=1381693 RepID=A0ABP0JUJ6_9DINO
MEQLEAALASADGSSQSWNEVYQHPKPSGSLKAYKKRFRLAQRIEKQALQSLNELELSRTSQAQAAQAATAAPPAAHDCGLASDVLEQYVAACGVDVDVGVGSLVLALNRLDTVTTLSSCSSIHVGAHEEEALVAFTASRTTAETLRQHLGEHFRDSREDVVQPRSAGQKAHSFSSYIVFSSASLPSGRPDAGQRLREMMMLAEEVNKLACSPTLLDVRPVGSPLLAQKPAPMGSEMALKASIGQQDLKCLKSTWSEGSSIISVEAFEGQKLEELRDELVGELKGLQPIETQHTVALVLPFSELSDQVSKDTCPALEVLRQTFEGDEWRRIVQEIVGSPLSGRPCCALVAVPPGGHVLPHCFGGLSRSTSEDVSFTLFLTESWWTQADGGLLELFTHPGAVTSASAALAGTAETRLVPQASRLYLYRAAAVGITRVVSDAAPQLALHGVFRGGATRAAGAGARRSWSPELLAFARCELRGPEALDSLKALESVMSADYLQEAQVESLRQKFEEESKLRLAHFLCDEAVQRIGSALQSCDLNGWEPGAGWQVLGPALERRCCSFSQKTNKPVIKKCKKNKKPKPDRSTSISKQHSAGQALALVAQTFSSPVFLAYLERLTGLTRTADGSVWIRRFRPGDYERPTCADAAQLDVTLTLETLTAGYAEQDAGERTAEAAGVLAGAKGVPCAPEVLLRLPLANNVLRVVLRDPQTSHSIEPLAGDARTSRWEIRLALPVQELEDLEPDELEPEEEPTGAGAICAMPSCVLGVIGVGTIASAAIKGLCNPELPKDLGLRQIVLSPRNALKAQELQESFPALVRVAESNQEVVQCSDWILLSVLPKQALAVLSELEFRKGQEVISMMAGISLSQLRQHCQATVSVAIPYPAIAHRHGAALLLQPGKAALAIFQTLGRCVTVEDEGNFRQLMGVSGLMGNFYKQQLTVQQWLTTHGISGDTAAAWTTASFAAWAEDSGGAAEATLARLLAEQTPGGLNEKVWQLLDEDGANQALTHAMACVHWRLQDGHFDPDLAPARQRLRRQRSAQRGAFVAGAAAMAAVAAVLLALRPKL